MLLTFEVFIKLVIPSIAEASCPLGVVDTCPSPGTLRTGLHTPQACSLPPSAEAHGLTYPQAPWPNFSSGARPSLYYEQRDREHTCKYEINMTIVMKKLLI